MNPVDEQPDQPAVRGFWARQLRPTPAERRKMDRRQRWIFLGLAYFLLIAAYAWPTDWRNESPWFVRISWSAFIVRVFQFHLGLAVLMLTFLAAWRRQRAFPILALPLLIFTLGPALRSWLPRETTTNQRPDLVVMSCNLLMINRATDAVIDQLEKVDPDVILFQEYTDDWHAAFLARLGQRYPHIVHVPRDDSFGSAIYSRHPFVTKPQKYLNLGTFGEPQMRAVLRVRDQDIALYNLHLVPPWGGRKYVCEHRAQFADLLDLLAKEELPALVGGDFNFTETTPYAAAMRAQGFCDAQDEAGSGRGATWPKLGLFRWAPGLRLDHLYLSRGLQCGSLRALAPCGSDHRPIVGEIVVTPDQPPASKHH